MPNNRNPKVLDVGQCDLDHGNIERMLSQNFGAEVERVATIEEAIRAVRAGHHDLVLVNRILDADATSGLELIRRLRSHKDTLATPVMLVSNHADAQDTAVALGATRGFGKAALTHAATRELLASLLGP